MKSNINNIGKICPYCQTPIKPGIPVAICPACEIPHHKECWEENHGCTTYGCKCQHQTSLPLRESQQQPQPHRVQNHENTSGQGSSSIIPVEIRRWNWGAFLFSLLWSLCNRVWIGLLVLVPYIGFIMVFILGAKGSEWAWRNKKWKSIGHFQMVQRAWAKWGLVYLVVIPILLAMLLPALARAREQARRAVCISNLKQTGLALHMFAQDYQESFPEDLSQLYSGYITDNQVFICPSRTGITEQDISRNPHTCYEYITGLTEEFDENCLIVFDREQNHPPDGRNVLFLGGDAKWIPSQTWQSTWQVHIDAVEQSREAIRIRQIQQQYYQYSPYYR